MDEKNDVHVDEHTHVQTKKLKLKRLRKHVPKHVKPATETISRASIGTVCEPATKTTILQLLLNQLVKIGELYQ